MENPIKMDDLGVPLFLETTLWIMEPQYTPERFDEWKAKMMGLGKCVLGIYLLHTLIN